MPDALNVIFTKRDTRSYADRPIGKQTMDNVLNAARLAGSAKNQQPVRLVVVTETEGKTAIKDAGDYAEWIDTAPAVIVLAVHDDAGPRRLFDVGRHAQNLMLAAHAEGLASCPVTIHRPDGVRAHLGFPDEYEPVMFVTLGAPAENASDKPRRSHPRLPLDDYARHGRWEPS